MTTWFTSDLHLFHRAVAYERRYGQWPEDRSVVTPEDVEWHNDMLARNWDAVVRPGDKVWVVGDMTASDRSIEDALDWICERSGDKEFVAGNHDPCHPMHRDAHKWQRRYMAEREVDGEIYIPFGSVQAFAKHSYRIAGEKVEFRVSHFPYDGDHTRESRYDEWRLKRNDDGFLLHGHVHSRERINGNMIHVGVDAWDYAPVSLETITGYVETMWDAAILHGAKGGER